MRRVLIVGGEERLHQRLRLALTFERIQTVSAHNADQASEHIARSEWALIVMSGQRSEPDSIKLLLRMRREGREEPVMWLCRKATSQYRIRLYRLGANDVVDQDANTEELVVRALNLIKLGGMRKHVGRYQQIDSVIIDKQGRTVTREHQKIELTPTEYELLLFLAEHAGTAMSRERILREVWGYEFHGQTNLVDVYIRYLRLKLEKGYGKKIIHTVRGYGYMIGEQK